MFLAMVVKMALKILAPSDLIYDLEEALPDDVILGRDVPVGLELGGTPWIEVDPAKLKAFVAYLVEKVSSFLSARPNAGIRVGDIEITLENVSEATINTAIEKVIAASEKRNS